MSKGDKKWACGLISKLRRKKPVSNATKHSIRGGLSPQTTAGRSTFQDFASIRHSLICSVDAFDPAAPPEIYSLVLPAAFTLAHLALAMAAIFALAAALILLLFLATGT